MDKIHRGVGLLITNNARTNFFVQIKDEDYPFAEWRGACSYWGGAIEEEDGSELIALERELEEEIPEALILLKGISRTKIATYWVDKTANPFWMTVFECVVSEEQLEQISLVKVQEGKGELMDRSTLLEHQWVFKMDFIFEKYIRDVV